ncbi:hypothetical protein [Polaromonas sp. UBA4122]|uniref:hypothetical protein n=1 Tax=Polaromonas sp. UBA4122 TaxID=1947074 RepID=UPI0026A3B99B
MPAHYPLDHAAVAQVVEPSRGTIALAGGIVQCQVARRTGAGFGQGVEETLLQRHRHGLGKANVDEAIGDHGVAVVNQPHRIGGTHDLVAPRANLDRIVEMGMHAGVHRFRIIIIRASSRVV